MAAGHDTYVSRLLTAAGWANALPTRCRRYPRLDPANVSDATRTVQLLSSEPYPFKLPRHLDAFPGRAAAEGPGRWRLEGGTAALEVDGQLLSCYPSLTAAGLRVAVALRESRAGTLP